MRKLNKLIKLMFLLWDVFPIALAAYLFYNNHRKKLRRRHH